MMPRRSLSPMTPMTTGRRIPPRTSVAVFKRFAAGLGDAFAGARQNGRLLFGFAEQVLTATFVASSTGLRRRFDQPTGRVEINAKSADFRRSAWEACIPAISPTWMSAR